jgi:hypothetical protein
MSLVHDAVHCDETKVLSNTLFYSLEFILKNNEIFSFGTV